MGYITLAVLMITLIALVFGFLFGIGRGLNRSLLRLGLIVVCMVLAIFLREPCVKLLMNARAGDGTLNEKIVGALGGSEGGLPATMQSLILTLAELIIGLLAFGVIFYVLRYLTWFIAYPLLKIVVKAGINKRKLLGGVVGLVQGALIAFVIITPMSGILVQFNKLSQMEIDGEKVLELPAEIGVEDYVNSPLGKIYNTSGGWLFDVLTTGEDVNGKKVTVSDACDVLVTFGGLTGTMEALEDSVEVMASETATAADRISAMKTAGKQLTEIGNSMNDLGYTAKSMVNELLTGLKEILSSEEEGIPEELENLLDNLTVDNLKLGTAGKSLTGIATYIEKTDEELGNNEPVSEQEIKDIVNGFADNGFIMYMFTIAEQQPTLLEVQSAHEGLFEATIENTDLSREEKDVLLKLFGLDEE